MIAIFFVALSGFEPRHTVPETAVLPLHHKAISLYNKRFKTEWFSCINVITWAIKQLQRQKKLKNERELLF